MNEILLVASRLPFPPVGGDRLKNYNLIKILSRYFKIHFVCIHHLKLNEEEIKFLDTYTHTYKVFVKSRFQHLLAMVFSLFNKLPFQINYYYFRDIQCYINRILPQVDLSVCTLVRTAQYLINKKHLKILDMADSIGQNYQNSLKYTSSFFWKIIYKLESDRLISFEKKCLKHFDKTLLFNKKEIEYFGDFNNAVLLRHGVNEDLLSYEKRNIEFKNTVCFFGKMSTQPNQDAVIWFANNVMPSLSEDIEFLIVGADPSKKIIEICRMNKRVSYTGYLKDPYEVLQNSLCVVSPMQTGAGIQNKILESMALGTINIVSTIASVPIGASNKEDYIVLDSPSEISDIICDIRINPDSYSNYKRNSREFIKNNFTWGLFESDYISAIRSLNFTS